MLRSLTVLIVAALAIPVLAEETKPDSRFGDKVHVPSNIGFSTNISDDQQAATILFDNAYVDVDSAVQGAVSTRNQTAIQTKTITLHVPYSSKQGSLTMTMDVRGFQSADTGASVRLVACVGDATQVVDMSPDKTKSTKLRGKSKKALASEHPDIELGDFQDRVEFTVKTHAAKPVLQITLFLIAEHDTDAADSGGALLAVDSLDLVIGKHSKGKYR